MSADNWTGQLAWEERRGGKRLTVIVQRLYRPKSGLCWAGLGVEAPAEADSLAEILAAHSHVDLGAFDSVTDALTAANDYIGRWLDGHPAGSPCECGPVSLTPEEITEAVAEAELACRT